MIEAVSNTGNGKNATPEQQAQVLKLARSLETLSPVPQDILTNPQQAQQLDGVWYLQWTSPSELEDGQASDENAWKPENAEEGESKITTKRFDAKGSVSAAGITVDTSNRVTQQIIDTNASTVTNRVDLGWGVVEVGGSFRVSSSVPIRAVVAFNKADITLQNGFVVSLGLVFDILSVVRGSRDNGWLETTYIDPEIRIGRGNKGTLFVLTRDVGMVSP